VKVNCVVLNNFDHQALHFYISSAEHALQYAPLQEFQSAIAALKAYDAAPTDENLRVLKAVDKGLRRPKYAYTARDEYRFALVNVIQNVLAGLHSVNLSDTVHFAECASVAARETSPWAEASAKADAAFRREAGYHNDLWRECCQ
jgi:hypothetical protein